MNFEKYLVGGHVYEINRDNLNKYPSLIFNNHDYMKQFYDKNRQCYCLARNRSFFELLIFYINHGILSRPNDLPLVNEFDSNESNIISIFSRSYISQN